MRDSRKMIKTIKVSFLSICLLFTCTSAVAKTTKFETKSTTTKNLVIKKLSTRLTAKRIDKKETVKLSTKKQSKKIVKKKFKKNVSKKKLSKKLIKKKSAIKKAFKKPKKKKHGFTGGFTLKTSLKDTKTTLGASIKWKPILKDYYYFKVGLKHDFATGKEKFSYSWHLGYDDWHEGTWTPQINHWGGIKPGEAFDSGNAIASLGYKVKSDFLQDRKLKSGITISKKLGGNAPFKLSTSLQWAPRKFWYIKGILVHALDGSDGTWNYLFGYDDWHANTWGFEYSNYDSNPLNETNFKKSGKFAITYKWEY